MTGPLITVADLRTLIEGDAAPLLLDVRYRVGGPSGRGEYDAGHVPGAVYLDLDTALASPAGEGGRHPLPDTEAFEAAMRAVGVDDGRPVVVYDDWFGHAAGRAWWLLRFHGHRDVRLLDGGWQAWLRAGGARQAVAPVLAVGDFTARPGAMPLVEADQVPDVAMLIDARAAERYRGEVEPIDPVAGHIPGAINVPTSTNLRADGTFRSPDELRALYAAAGVVGDVDVAVYCGSGVTATHDIVALASVGIEAALYPGSWSEWIADPTRPVARD